MEPHGAAAAPLLLPLFHPLLPHDAYLRQQLPTPFAVPPQAFAPHILAASPFYAYPQQALGPQAPDPIAATAMADEHERAQEAACAMMQLKQQPPLAELRHTAPTSLSAMARTAALAAPPPRSPTLHSQEDSPRGEPSAQAFPFHYPQQLMPVPLRLPPQFYDAQLFGAVAAANNALQIHDQMALAMQAAVIASCAAAAPAPLPPPPPPPPPPLVQQASPLDSVFSSLQLNYFSEELHAPATKKKKGPASSSASSMAASVSTLPATTAASAGGSTYGQDRDDGSETDSSSGARRDRPRKDPCVSCNTRQSPAWRRLRLPQFKDAAVPLCNACGIKFHKRNVICHKCLHVPSSKDAALHICPRCNAVLPREPIPQPPPRQRRSGKAARVPAPAAAAAAARGSYTTNPAGDASNAATVAAIVANAAMNPFPAPTPPSQGWAAAEQH